LFLYRQVLDVELPWLENVIRASRPKRLPVVLSTTEVRSVLAQLDGTCWLIANLLYGSGLRLMEAHRLRVKDLVLERGEIIVRDAKGGKDRVTVLPDSLVAPLREHLSKLYDRFGRQRKLGEPGVSLPTAFARKYPRAATQWGWQWVFPANSLCRDAYTGLPTRHHRHQKIVQPAVEVLPLNECLQSSYPALKKSPGSPANLVCGAFRRITAYSVIRRLWLYYA
jgi:integrase